MSNESYASGTAMVKPKADKNSNNGLPTDGIFPVDQWAEQFGISSDQFGNWIEKYEIPFFRPGKMRYVSAADVWCRLPYFTHAKEPEGE